MPNSELRELLRRAFLVGYDCGRLDEREDRALDMELPDNVVSLDAARDELTRRQANA